MYTQEQINRILQLIEDEKERLGSFAAVAKKCKISETALSQVRSGKYGASGDDIYDTIALALGYDFDNGNWKMAEITNYFEVLEVLETAKKEQLFVGISEKAGSCKSATSKLFLEKYKREGAFMLTCKEWSAREYLQKLAIEIGAEMPKGYVRKNDMIDIIADSIKKKSRLKPIIIIDQSNSLKPSARVANIHIFNECEDIMAMVIIGTDNLEYEIKRGVRLNKVGYDELDSRFGRKYIHLTGANIKDVRAICAVNGIKDADKQRAIFEECEPVRKEVGEGRTIMVVEDIRRVKRIVKRERLLRNEH